MMSGLLAGANFVFHAAGWLEGGLTMGYEKFVMDLDHCGMMQRMLGGLKVDDDSLAADAYREVGPGGNYLATAHTLSHFESANYLSEMADTDAFEQWRERGSLDCEARAQARWQQMLADYEPPPLDSAIAEALAAFVARRKADMPDEWH